MIYYLGFGKLENSKMLDELLKSFALKQITPDLIFLHNAMDSYIRYFECKYTFNVYIHSLPFRCRKFTRAVRIFQLVNPNSVHYSNSWIPENTIGNDIEIDTIIASFKSKIQSILPNVRTYNIMIKCLRELKKYSYVRSELLLEDMKINNICPDSITINSIIDLAVVSGRLKEAEILIKNQFAVPTVEAFISLITGYSHKNDVVSAFKVLELMSTYGILPNSYTLTSLITTCVNANDFRTAKQIISNNTYHSLLSPDEISIVYGSLISGLCRKSLQMHNSNPNINTNINEKEYEKRLQYFFEAQIQLLNLIKLNLKPNIFTINSVLNVFCTIIPSGIKYALKLYRSMIIDNIQPNQYTYSILLNGLGKQGYAIEALHLYQTAEKDSNNNIDTLRSLVNEVNKNSNKKTNLDKNINIKSDFLILNKIYKNRKQKYYSIINSNNNSSVSTTIRDFINWADNIDNIKDIENFIKRKQIENELKLKMNNNNNKLFKNMNSNQLLNYLYRTMKYRYMIDTDERMITTLNALFALTIATNNNGKFWNKLPEYDIELSRFIFEDLVISGWHPNQVSICIHSI